MKPLRLTLFAWSSLGFYRGINKYNYSYEKNKQKYDKTKYYSKCFGEGFIGIMVYLNPFLTPLCLYKEIQRLTINICTIDYKKKSDNYYRLF
jgi:hypothetical protein